MKFAGSLLGFLVCLLSIDPSSTFFVSMGVRSFGSLPWATTRRHCNHLLDSDSTILPDNLGVGIPDDNDVLDELASVEGLPIDEVEFESQPFDLSAADIDIAKGKRGKLPPLSALESFKQALSFLSPADLSHLTTEAQQTTEKEREIAFEKNKDKLSQEEDEAYVSVLNDIWKMNVTVHNYTALYDIYNVPNSTLIPRFNHLVRYLEMERQSKRSTMPAKLLTPPRAKSNPIRCLLTTFCSMDDNSNEKDHSAIETAKKIYDYIRQATNNDPRVAYHIQVFAETDEDIKKWEIESFEKDNSTSLSIDDPTAQEYIQNWNITSGCMKDSFQMICESYNFYHLIDGYAMKEVWQRFRPDILLQEKNLKAVAEKVKHALYEDESGLHSLNSQLQNVRFGAGEPYYAPGEYITDHAVIAK